MTEVLEGEVVSEETTFTPDPPALPLGGSLFGHCQDAKDLAPWPEIDRREIEKLHLDCPAVLQPRKWPDPARKGTFYWSKGRRCPCACHTRPVVSA